MRHGETFPATWSDSMGGRPDNVAKLMMAELDHRVSNGLSCAIAQLEIARLRLPDAAGADAIGKPITMLRGLATVQRVLAPPVGASEVDFAALLERLCAAIAEFRLESAGILLLLDADRVVLPSRTAWLLATAALELITNAAKHGCASGGTIRVRLAANDRGIAMRVTDSRANVGIAGAPPVSSGAGTGIVDAIVGYASGTVSRKATLTGMTVTVRCRFAREGRHALRHRLAGIT